jgi:tRNA G18 (ribose-2'-O)-methylase SpoU
MRKLTNEELDRKSVTEFRASEKSPFIIVLDNVRSLNNIGSIFRTADAFLVEGLWLCGITATPPHREIHKTALGATESVAWRYFANTAEAVRELRESGYVVVSVEQADGSVSLDRFVAEPGKKYALVFGHEIKGVSDEVVDMSDTCIEIPQYGTKHSFNVAVSAGIVLWELAGHAKR